jgi:adenine-specific DNA-methyltransferase
LPEDTITDNLLIKGNNLLALHSLKEEFAGKVKLVYIDPPYNTGNDSFQYNDRFNESTWLTFMQNRLIEAKKLLSKDGVIFVQCDDNEQAYLKILLDEVFKPHNFVETFVWRNTDNAPALSKKTRKNIEFIHCYEKKINTSRGYVGRKSDNDDAPLLNSGNPITELVFKPGLIHFKIPDGKFPEGKFEKIE